LGDLNYRIEPEDDFNTSTVREKILNQLETEQFREYFQTHDELDRTLLGRRIPNFHEGISPQQNQYNKPTFYPTCNKIIDREIPISYQLKNLTPSYCDRILYQTVDKQVGKNELYSLDYQDIDLGVTFKSDHSAVWGLFGFRIREFSR